MLNNTIICNMDSHFDNNRTFHPYLIVKSSQPKQTMRELTPGPPFCNEYMNIKCRKMLLPPTAHKESCPHVDVPSFLSIALRAL